MNGVEKFVTETTETIEDEEQKALEKPNAKARPRMKSTITPTPVSVPLQERKWRDVNPGRHDRYVISKAMIRLLRHDQTILRETDGAVKFDDTIVEFKKKRFDGALQWSFEDWTSILARGGGQKARFQTLPDTVCFSQQSQVILVVLQLILSCKTTYCYRKDLPSTSTSSGMWVKCIQ